MNTNLFTGELVRLAALDAEASSEANVRWLRNTEFHRLEDSGASFPHSRAAIKKWNEKWLEKNGNDVFAFTIHTRADDRLIGGIDLEISSGWNNGEAFVGIGIGEPEYWSKGYGTEAMRLILRYAFTELNLHRVALNVFEYNPRAVRSYENAGFQHEGRIRQMLNRNGRRWDVIFMGILRPEWEAQQPR